MIEKTTKLLAAAIVAGSLSTPAFAADEAPAAEPTPDWTFPMSVSLVSDYIFRGQTQTWGRPAAQFSVEADHSSGFYAGFFLSNVSDKWLPGAHVETDYYAGFRNKLPGAASIISYDVGLIYYAYPGGNWDESVFDGFNKSNKLDTAEAYIGLTYDWLTFKTGRTLNEYWGWSTNNSPVNGGFANDLGAGVTGNTRGSYFYELDANYALPDPSWVLVGQVGRQVIHNSTGLDLTYYKAGVTKTFDGGWAVGAFYSATNEPDAYKNFLSLENGRSDYDIAKDRFFISVSKSF